MNSLQADILWLGYEDVSGLWEIDWNDGPSAVENLVFARVAVVEVLARSGSIVLLAGVESVELTGLHVTDPGQISVVLSDTKAWCAPENGLPTVRFRTTEKGFAQYREAIEWHDQT